jgi:L-aminopeptidase/D-esterase-like protein
VLPQWQFAPGRYNAITDVPGVQVGHITLQADTPQRIRTGVTAIVPHRGNLATTALWAYGQALHGNGEMTGLSTIQDTGLLNSPILLTNTYAVGAVHQGVMAYFNQTYPGQWSGQLPVVAECYDGYYNTIEALDTVRPAHAVAALRAAQSGPVPQGRVGAGTGMRSFELHAGIGSASRRVLLDDKTYTIGVLVNANHSRLAGMNPQVRRALETRLGPLALLQQQDAQDAAQREPATARPQPVPSRQGSIIVVIATDMPIGPMALKDLAQWAALGIGATGSTMDTSSGDFVLAFSTANPVPVPPLSALVSVGPQLHPDVLTPALRATVEAVTEAQINALLAAHTAAP